MASHPSSRHASPPGKAALAALAALALAVLQPAAPAAQPDFDISLLKDQPPLTEQEVALAPGLIRASPGGQNATAAAGESYGLDRVRTVYVSLKVSAVTPVMLERSFPDDQAVSDRFEKAGNPFGPVTLEEIRAVKAHGPEIMAAFVELMDRG